MTTIDRPTADPTPTAPAVPDAPPRTAFAWLAGPAAITAGVATVVGQLLWLPYDPKDHVPTAQNTVFQAGNLIYLVGFVALAIATVALHARQAHRTTRGGDLAAVAAVVGTFLLGGDLWFETFAIPWLADGTAPQVLDGDPSTYLALGAITSYLAFAIGWLSFGIATFRARVFPRAFGIALAISGVLAFNALLAPFGIPLGFTMAALGAWILRNDRR